MLNTEPMLMLMAAFTLFHLVAGTASLGLAMRLLTKAERAQWRSKRALVVAQALCWIYPLIAFSAGSAAWRVFNAGGAHGFPLMLAPILWLVVMGIVFAIVDFAEDGILGNARSR
jgi:hypothetical protein